jgi:hypothetical protein
MFNHHAGFAILGDDIGGAVQFQIFGYLGSVAFEVGDGFDITDGLHRASGVNAV